jgi:hypothetical protein
MACSTLVKISFTVRTMGIEIEITLQINELHPVIDSQTSAITFLQSGADEYGSLISVQVFLDQGCHFF